MLIATFKMCFSASDNRKTGGTWVFWSEYMFHDKIHDYVDRARADALYGICSCCICRWATPKYLHMLVMHLSMYRRLACHIRIWSMVVVIPFKYTSRNMFNRHIVFIKWSMQMHYTKLQAFILSWLDYLRWFLISYQNCILHVWKRIHLINYDTSHTSSVCTARSKCQNRNPN